MRLASHSDPIHLVWFKRDLRLSDHAPLAAACASGRPTLLVYAFEPILIEGAESDPRHWRFAWQAAKDLQQRLAQRGHRLYLWGGNFDERLARLLAEQPVAELLSHQETGLKASFDRDRRVKRLCAQHGVRWREWRQDGVFRGIQGRNDWWQRWEADMQAPLVQPDLGSLRSVTLSADLAGTLAGDPLPPVWQERPAAFQPGGESYARRYLDSFLHQRAAAYTRLLSKPEGSRHGSSRLSPYLAHGNLSVREVYQWTRNLEGEKPYGREFERFRDRLWWRSHYTQKLETEYQIQWRPINHGLSALHRPFDEEIFAAFAQGRTGFPLIDACVRCLHHNGYLNFRMRAMLATFATFTLWQPMTKVAQFLAQVFLDYEPGIHYGQLQMQSGLSGYHPLRIFNPTLQAQRHDPQGNFIRRYVPELAQVPAPQLFTPWSIPLLEQQMYHCQVGLDYPAPIVDYEAATQRAKDHYWTLRSSEAAQAYLPILWERHCLPGDKAKYYAKGKVHS
jgi:deoxyribodipyrimidine photo-lyase